MKYKKIKIPIGYEDIRMFEELADGHRKPFTWTFDEIDVEFIKDDEEDCDEPKEDMVGFEGTWEALDKLTNIKHLPDKEEK